MKKFTNLIFNFSYILIHLFNIFNALFKIKLIIIKKFIKIKYFKELKHPLYY